MRLETTAFVVASEGTTDLRFGIHCIGYAQYTDVERNSIPLKTPGPTTQMIGDLPYERLRRPVWFPDRHDGVVTPTIRQFTSEDRTSGSTATVSEEVVAMVSTAASSVEYNCVARL